MKRAILAPHVYVEHNGQVFKRDLPLGHISCVTDHEVLRLWSQWLAE